MTECTSAPKHPPTAPAALQPLRCYFCPPIPRQPGTPPTFGIGSNAGWNAGAYSIMRRDSDCYTEFSVAVGASIAIGLAFRRRSLDPSTLHYGAVFTALSGVPLYQVVQRGVIVSAPVPRVGAIKWRIQRSGRYYSLWADDDLLDEADLGSGGSLIVVANMYAVGDEVG